MPGPGTNFPVSYVAVVVGYEVADGKVEEVVHQVDSKACDILSVQHGVERKSKVVVDPKTNEVDHYEATGEEILQLKVKYIREK